MTPKLRMLAGPNGSGKSTLLDYLQHEYTFSWGYCLNPDNVDRQLMADGCLDLKSLGIQLKQASLQNFMRSHPLFPRLPKIKFAVSANRLTVQSGLAPGYFSAIVCDFIRKQWLSKQTSFTFETVMSAKDKIELFQQARMEGYRTYLYYICTDDPLINEQRISNRLQQGGHGVPPDKIRPRYRRSLNLLPAAISLSNRAYMFDNSTQHHRLVAEFEDGRLIKSVSKPPRWLIESVLKK